MKKNSLQKNSLLKGSVLLLISSFRKIFCMVMESLQMCHPKRKAKLGVEGSLVAFLFALILVACGGDSANDSGTDTESSSSSDIQAEEIDLSSSSYEREEKLVIKNKTITGFAQKGPFKKGASVEVFEVELEGSFLKQTGKSFTGQVSNDSGAFKITNVSLKSQYALFRVTGRFKSEINGKSVLASLVALTDLSKNETVNVNVVTHLEFDRVLHLLHQGLDFTAAKKQAEREVLAAFGIDVKFKNAEKLNLFGDSDADAALVAISKLVLAGDKKESNRDQESLLELLTQIASSVEENGEWDNIGGRNNSAKDYCPWDNKWNVGRTLGNYGDKGNCVFDTASNAVEKYIRHFIVSWHTVGQYCTSTLEGKVVGAWSDGYRDIYLCKDGEWHYVGRGSGDKKDYVVDSVDGSWKFIGKNIQWCKEYLALEVSKWSKGKDGEIKKGSKTGTNYKYDKEKGEWCETTDLDTLLGACTIKQDGKVVKGKGEKDSYYSCDNGDWREATEYEVGVSNNECTKDGAIVKFTDESFYKCSNDEFVQADFLDSALGLACVSYIDGKSVERLNAVHTYTCEKNAWKISDTWSKTNCAKDGYIQTLIYDMSGKTKEFVCDADTFRVATNTDSLNISLYGAACVSYTDGKKDAAEKHVCEDHIWKEIVSNSSEKGFPSIESYGTPSPAYTKNILNNAKKGWGSRYWDACKPHCSWISDGHEGKTDTTTQKSYEAGMTTARNCNIHDVEVPTFTLGHAVQAYWYGFEGTNSACGNAKEKGVFTCTDMAPIAVNDSLSYAYVAALMSTNSCGKCFHLQFDGSFKDVSSINPPKETHLALKGKHLIAMIVSNGHDIEEDGRFDLMVPGGGVGAFDALSTQVNGSYINWGAGFGGFLTECQSKHGEDNKLEVYQECVKDMCDAAFGGSDFPNLWRGCHWFAEWYMAADNPTYNWEEVDCPQYLIDHYMTTINTTKDNRYRWHDDWSTYKKGDPLEEQECLTEAYPNGCAP